MNRGLSMKMRRMHITIKWLIVALISTLMPCIAFAAAATLDEQSIEAAKKGSLGFVETLLKEGADVNAQTKDGPVPPGLLITKRSPLQTRETRAPKPIIFTGVIL